MILPSPFLDWKKKLLLYRPIKRRMQKYSYKGVSLIEMIVAISILSLMATGVAFYFSRIWPLQKFALDSAKAQLTASQSVTSLTKLFRNMRQSDSGDYALHTANSTGVIFFADQDGDAGVERVRVFLDGTTLKMGIIHPVGNPISYPVNQESVQILLTDTRNGVGSHPSTIFHYYDEGNVELTGGFSIGDVRMIGIDLYVDINPSSSPEATHIESFASIRNLTENDRL